VSICTDMGTEMGLATFQGSVQDLLPLGFEMNAMEMDDGAGGPPAVLGNVDPFFLPHALPVPGLQHCVHNLLKEAHEAMEHWPRLWQQLKNLEALLRFCSPNHTHDN
jgi:hypothetical protein